jgi:glc operon protein GlcG
LLKVLYKSRKSAAISILGRFHFPEHNGHVILNFYRFLYNFAYFMKNKPVLELSDIKTIAAAAEAHALKNNWPVTIAIADDGGHLLFLQRMDGAAALSAHIAPGKAQTSALGRKESKVYEDMINGGRASFLSAPDVKALLEGGVPIMKDGQCLGAVGVSGVKSSEDAEIAKAGIAALGF